MEDPAPGFRPSLQSASEALRRTIRDRPWRALGVALVLALNLALLLLYLWSRGGSTTHVRIEAVGDNYKAFVDGKLIASGGMPGRDEGGIGFVLGSRATIPSMPGPEGIDSVRVTDALTQDVLFEDDFDGGASELWQDSAGAWRVDGGVFTSSTPGTFVTTGLQPWRDYVLEAELRNPKNVTVHVRTDDIRNTVAFRIRPFRHYDSFLVLFQDGAEASSVRGARLELDRGETIRSIVATLLRPYPTALLIVAGSVAIAAAVRLPRLERRLRDLAKGVVEVAPLLIGVLAVGALILLWYVNYVIGDAIPHVPDSVAYLFQAKIFASFRLTADPPPVPASFSFFQPPFLHVVDGRWFSQYPFGHPLFLSIGQVVGAVWLVPPVLGAASVFLTYRVGQHVYGAAVGVLAAILLFFSPFFQMTASNFMSHGTAVFVILACLFLIVRPTTRRRSSMFFAGIFLGLLFNMRPLVAVAFIPVLGGLMGYELVRAGQERNRLLREDLAFAAGAVLMLVAYFLYNNATTGSFTKNPQVLTFGQTENWVGFGGRHSVATGLQNEQELLAFMLLVVHGWPVAVGMLFAALPFVLGTRHRWDYFLGAGFLSLASANIFYLNAATMHGPRFWYETTPFLMLLTARGVYLLAGRASAAGDWLRARLRPGDAASAGAGVTSFALLSLVAGLIAFSAHGWMFEQHDAWSEIDFVPQKISMLEGFNRTDGRLLDAADDLDLENALVLVERCPHWWCFGSVFWTNAPDLDTEVVWASRRRTLDDIALLDHYADRSLYLADYGSRLIQPVTRAAIEADVREALAAAEAEAGAEPADDVPPPTAPLTPIERDELRQRHLDELRAALEAYRDANGAYPNTRYRVHTLCVFAEADAGCALESVLPQLPSDPLGEPVKNGYWYASDGVTFVLVAQLEATDDQVGCPEGLPLPTHVRGLYCIQGGGPTPVPPEAG